MQRYVYILSEGGDGGAYNVCATLDRSALIGLFERQWAATPGEWRALAISALTNLMSMSDAVLTAQDGCSLHDGWGGAWLHVVPVAGLSIGDA